MSSLEYQEQVEAWLGRPLEPTELVPIATFEELSPLQLAVVETLDPHNAVVAMHHLRAIIPDAMTKNLMPFIDGIASSIRDRNAARKSWS